MKVIINKESLILTLRNHKEISIAEKINTNNSYQWDLDLQVNKDSNEWFPTLLNVGQEAKAEHVPCDGCQHFCFSKAEIICGCSDSFILANDSKSCIPKPCNDAEFQCSNGECIHHFFRCDGFLDCEDESDEELCIVPCTSDQFNCSNRCIEKKEVCDGYIDCHDGSDEVNCTNICTSDLDWKCESGECIPQEWLCDGVAQCNDKSSDEANCGTLTYLDTQLKCGNASKCVPSSWWCDKTKDCLNGEDERSCYTCDDTNGGCDHLCYNSPGKRKCGCNTGFRLAADNKTCNDINECEEIPNLCHHICKNKNGSYNCFCNDGFSLKADDVNCKLLEEADWNFVLADSDALIYLNEEMAPTNAIFLHTPLVNRSVSFIYDRANKSFLAIDDEAGIVYRLINDSYTKEFSGLTFPTTSAAKNVFSTITASSFDYVNNNLYMAVFSSTDTRLERTTHSTILKVCSLDKKICANLLTTNVQISSMVASPKMCNMYMCENQIHSDSGSDSNGRIVSRKLNGEEFAVLVNTKIQHCTSISLDEDYERIYWIDGGGNRIESVDNLGHDRKLFTSEEVHHARELAVINNNILWFNADNRMVVKCYLHDPFDCCETYHVKDVSILDTKQVYNELTPTPCNSSHCPHICVPESREIPHCLCATGFEEKNQTCPSASMQEDYVCGSGICQTMTAQAVAWISIISFVVIGIVITGCMIKKDYLINKLRRRRILYSNSNSELLNNEETVRYIARSESLNFKEGAVSADVAVDV